MTLELKNVSRRLDGQTHIHPTNLILEKGTMNILLGRTLSGKTSLMRLMAGLDVPSSGKIIWHGKDVTGQRVQDRKIAMVYQQFINYPGMTVYQNIASPLKLMGMSVAEIDRAVRSTAEMLQLTAMLDRKPLELSGGQQQRCALARALVKRAELVLLDEPLANLDYKLREELRAEIPKIFEASGAIFVYATTEPEEALLLGGNTATLSEGRLTQFGLTPDVYRTPANVTSARVFSDPPMNFMDARKAEDKFHFGSSITINAEGAFSEFKDGKYAAGFRANHLKLTKNVNHVIEISCQVVALETTGSQSFFHLIHESERFVALIEGVHSIEQGSNISLWLDPYSIYLFDHSGNLVTPATNGTAT